MSAGKISVRNTRLKSQTKQLAEQPVVAGRGYGGRSGLKLSLAACLYRRQNFEKVPSQIGKMTKFTVIFYGH